MQKLITLAEPIFLLRIIETLSAVFPDGLPISIAVRPKTYGAETPDDFFGAEVFPMGQFDRLYVPYGPPVYEVNFGSLPSGKIELVLSERWCERALSDHYHPEPFLLEFSDRVLFARADKLFSDGPTCLRAPSAEPLSQEGLQGAQFHPFGVDTSSVITIAGAERPIYRVLSLDENCSITVQLDKRWMNYRNELLQTRFEDVAQSAAV